MTDPMPEFLNPGALRRFADQERRTLTERDEQHYADFMEDAGRDLGGSFLGWLWTRFKLVMQESTMRAGIRKLLKGSSPWEDAPTFGAYWAAHKAFDRLSNHYGNLYRGSFILNYLLGAMAVAMALVPVGFAFDARFHHAAHDYALIFTGLELAMILTVLGIHKKGANPPGKNHRTIWLGIRINRRWHERWLEYRVLAERLRYMEILYPLGIDPLKDGAARKGEGDDWVNATFAMCLVNTTAERCTDTALYRARLKAIMSEQSGYHRNNEHRCEHIHEHLHHFAGVLFFMTLGACAAHFVWHNPVLTLMSGFFPALAAAMHGIIASGEFSKLSQVSAQMHTHIESLLKELDHATDEVAVRQIAIEFHNTVIGEALSWKAVFNEKNVPLA